MKAATRDMLIGAGLSFGGIALMGNAKKEENENKQFGKALGAIALETSGMVMINKGYAEYTADKVAQRVKIEIQDMEKAREAKQKKDDVIDVDYKEVK